MWVEVVDVAGARAAVAAGAVGLVARGSESGGRVSELTSLVLLQELLAAGLVGGSGRSVPVWVAGGVGLHSAAGVVAAGAAGVVLDSQLALVREVELPSGVAAAVRGMDGSETAVLAGHRVFVRPDLPVAALVGRGAVPAGGAFAASPDTGGEWAADGAGSVTAAGGRDAQA